MNPRRFLNTFVKEQNQEIMMNRKFCNAGTSVVWCLIITLITGCSKDVDDEVSILGEWVEESPVENRTELFFYSTNRVTKTTDGSSDDYFYSISENSIVLWPDNGGDGGSSELFFRQIDENRFQIENLYVSIPEDEPTYMIFRRKGSEPVEEEDPESDTE